MVNAGGESQARGNLGYARLRTGHYEQARHAFKEALRIQSEIGFAARKAVRSITWDGQRLTLEITTRHINLQTKRVGSQADRRPSS